MVYLDCYVFGSKVRLVTEGARRGRELLPRSVGWLWWSTALVTGEALHTV